MEDAVSRMLLRLKKDIRRVKNMENRGKIHVIRTIQRNYRNGMVPFLLALRRRRKLKPRLVVLCDVSFSVSHASRFMLLLLHTLHNRMMDVRSFIFNAELAEITEMLSTAPINTMLEQIDSGEIVNLDDNSDYGKVLLISRRKFLDNLRGRPAVIFLGDARNNYNKANDWVLEQLREKAGYMLWLTPEDPQLWQRGDCIIETYGAWCDKVEMVKNVEELNRIVEDLFRNIYLEDEHRSRRRRRPGRRGNGVRLPRLLHPCRHAVRAGLRRLGARPLVGLLSAGGRMPNRSGSVPFRATPSAPA